MVKVTNEKVVMGAFVVLAFLVGTFVSGMAAPKGTGKGGFDDYGYNEKAEVFVGCLSNYYNWKLSKPAVECTETDMQVHANWHFDKEGNLSWLINFFDSPVSGDHVMKKYVTIGQQECADAEGRWLSFQKVTQTGETVPVCQIMEVISGEGPTLIATPAGFGLYKEE